MEEGLGWNGRDHGRVDWKFSIMSIWVTSTLPLKTEGSQYFKI